MKLPGTNRDVTSQETAADEILPDFLLIHPRETVLQRLYELRNKLADATAGGRLLDQLADALPGGKASPLYQQVATLINEAHGTFAVTATHNNRTCNTSEPIIGPPNLIIQRSDSEQAHDRTTDDGTA